MNEMEKGWFTRLLKPSKLKILVAVLIFVIPSFLPIYPTDTHQMTWWNGYYTYDDVTTYQPLFFVLCFQFSWVETDGRTGIIPDTVGTWVYTTSSMEADPSYLVIYIPIIILAYIAGCFLSEYIIWKRKFSKGVRDL